jgi:ABC-2 type transport system permease protein
MSPTRIGTIAGREFRGYFDQATAYILLVVFLGANFFFFFRSAFSTAEATLRPMFDLMPWLLAFLVPAVTMRAIAEDRASGTIELVLAQPIREIEYLLGKFVGILGFLAVALAGTVGAWFALDVGGDPYSGPAVAQYAGTLMLCGAFTAIGLWASATTRNQITAFIIAVAVIFSLMALTFPVVLIGLPPSLSAAAQRLGVMSHYRNITRGVLDLRDVVYFVSLVAVFLGLAYVVIERTRRNASSRSFRTLQAGMLGLVAIAVLANLLGRHIRGRWDLTPGGAYTLSEPTRDVLRELDDVVTIRFFASDDLPVQAQSVRRDIEDLLSDFRAVGGDNVRLLRRRPEDDNADAAEAADVGIPSVEFNTLGQGELQVRVGYLGIVLEYADASNVIPFVQDASGLEYRLTSAIVSMIRTRRPVVGFVSGLGGPPQDPEAGAGPLGLLGFAQQVGEAYAITTVPLTPDPAVADSAGGDSATTSPTGASVPATIPDSVDVLVLAGPDVPLSARSAAELRRFLGRGGNLLLMLQQIAVSRAQQITQPASHPRLDSLLAPYGVRVAPGLLVDVRSNTPLQITGSSGVPVQRPFPPFPVAVPVSDHPVVAGLSGVALAFASPLDLSGADTTTVTPLLATTEFGAVMPSESPLDPALDWQRLVRDLRPRPVAAAVLPRGEGAPETGGRIVLVGDADLVTNRFVARSRENAVFARNAIDWLAADESLIGIRAKQRAAPPLLYDSSGERDAAKYLTLVGIPLLFVIIGLVRLARRRRMAARPWSPREPDAT